MGHKKPKRNLEDVRQSLNVLDKSELNKIRGGKRNTCGGIPPQ